MYKSAFSLKAIAYSIALAVALPMMSSTASAKPKKATKTVTTKTIKKTVAKKSTRTNPAQTKKAVPAKKTAPTKKAPAKKPAPTKKPATKPAKPTPPAANPAAAKAQAQALIARFLDDKDNSLSWLCTVDKLTTVLKGQKQYASLLTNLKATRNEKNVILIGKKLESLSSHVELLNEKSATLIDSYSKIKLLALMKKRIALNGKPCS